jgi:hypothetical protein
MHSTVAAWQLAITAAQHLVGPLCFHHQLTSVFFSGNTWRIFIIEFIIWQILSIYHPRMLK